MLGYRTKVICELGEMGDRFDPIKSPSKNNQYVKELIDRPVV
jgi:hypothetical protein